MSIQKLSSESIREIATASTLQTLQSFVKELVENSLDAGSTQIIVTFFESGLDGISVYDNGCGISFTEWEKLCLRGRTSKIQKFSDLEKIETHGFRGEALNAISELSEISITSRGDEDIGWKWSKGRNPDRVNRERGTTVECRNLFYTLPVRKTDFLNNYKNQYRKAINNLTEYAIIYKDVDLRVWNHEKTRQIIISSGLHPNRLSLLGESVVESLLPFSVQIDEHSKASGFVSKYIDSGSSKGNIKSTVWFTYVNKRPINAPKNILKLMTEIYRQYNPQGKFVFVLYLELNRPGDVDYNVSVDKRDVYLKNEKLIVTKLQEIITLILQPTQGNIKTLTKQLATQDVPRQQQKIEASQPTQSTKRTDMDMSTISQKKSLGNNSFLAILQSNKNTQNDKQSSQITQQQQQQKFQITQQSKQQYRPASSEIITPKFEIIHQQLNQIDNSKIEQSQFTQQKEPSIIQIDLQSPSEQLEKSQILKNEQNLDSQLVEEIRQPLVFQKSDFQNLEIVGQFNAGFILCILQDKLFLLDQHACDEKRNYERLMKTHKLSPLQLMKPIRFELPNFQISQVEEHRELFHSFGYQFDIDGKNILLKSIPSYANQTFGQDIFLQLLENPSTKLPGIKYILASQACRQSVMIGTTMNRQQMKELLMQMATLDSPWNCPHGRPTFVRINDIKIEQVKQGFSEKYFK